MRDNKPNVLLIMADQFLADRIEAAGAEWLHTPNIDSIADGGVLFDHAYTNCPICAPAWIQSEMAHSTTAPEWISPSGRTQQAP